MKRKHFITSILSSAAALKLTGMNKLPHILPASGDIQKPPYLKPGDTIGITSPAGYITNEEIVPAIQKLKEWGFEVIIGDTIGKRDHTFGGTDDERRADMQRMLNDRLIKAVMCARGGYGMVRIIDALQFKEFVANPKWLIGFSDITALHSHVHTNFKTATIHSKMCNSFPDDWALADPLQRDTIESIRQCLVGEKMKYKVTPHPSNKVGFARGQLIGGNLKTLESLACSKSDLDTKDKILFVEDTGEYLYSIDRMFWNLKRSGKLAKLKGLVIGGFKIKKDDPGEEFGLTLDQIILEKIEDPDLPVCFDFPVGHQKNNYALKCGVVHSLSVSTQHVSLTET